MDDETFNAIRAHQEEFGEFDVTTFHLNLSDPSEKKKLIKAIEKAIQTGKPMKNKDLGIEIPIDVQV